MAYGGVTRERVYFSCCDVARRERAERQEVRRDCTVSFFVFFLAIHKKAKLRETRCGACGKSVCV